MRSAVLSPCGAYRYRLDRSVGSEGLVFAFFGVNPSTADANEDDATVRKWTGFTKRWGGRHFIVGNAFAFRSTDVRGLAASNNPIGLLNNRYLLEIASEADILVPCWGSRDKVPRVLRPRFEDVMAALRATEKPLISFGLTSGGDPKHPLMLGYDTPPLPLG